MNDAPQAGKRGLTAFDWDDPLLLDAQLDEDERAIRDAAHDYCQEKLFPRVLMAQPPRALRPRDHERDGRDGLPRRHARQPWLRRASTMSATG